MSTFADSKRRFDSWLREKLGSDLVDSDLQEKDRLMRQSAFVFLRGTYWRWAEIIFDVCPDLEMAPSVLAVGDIHLENFGTWRDADGRLIWGVNDFDEAANMPYAIDLVRLTASAALGADERDEGLALASEAILDGYQRGLEDPKPIVLDRDWAWLREEVVVAEDRRMKFWKKIDARRVETAPQRFQKALQNAMPEAGLAFDTARRIAGTGSLGRPRWMGVADWRGAPVVREAKAVLTSGWELSHGQPDAPARSFEIATGRYRAPDPWYRISDGIVVRRLSPNNRKLEADTKGLFLLSRDMLEAMGTELGNIHAATAGATEAIKADLAQRESGWLFANAENAANAVRAEYKQFKKM